MCRGGMYIHVHIYTYTLNINVQGYLNNSEKIVLVVFQYTSLITVGSFYGGYISLGN